MCPKFHVCFLNASNVFGYSSDTFVTFNVKMTMLVGLKSIYAIHV